MGMFDNVLCRYPTPWPELRDVTWQTKDTEAQFLDLYEVREDGTLWHEAYDGDIRETDDVVGVQFVRKNLRWEQEKLTGQVGISCRGRNQSGVGEHFDVLFWFHNGVVRDAVFYFNGHEVTKRREDNMLVLTRQVGQKIEINGGQIEVVVVDIKGDKVRLGVTAPLDVPVHREEIQDRIDQQQADGDDLIP